MKRLVPVIASLALAAGAFTQAAADEVVKVGTVLALTGPFASMGDAVDKGAKLYVKLHQKDLPKGVSVELIRRDNAGPNPSAAKRLAQEMVVRDKISYLTGAVFTPDAAAIAPLATEAKLPFILPNATTSSLTRQSPYIVRVSLTQWQVAYPMGQWAAKQGNKTAYVVVADYAAGYDTQEAFTKGFTESGGEVTGVIRIPQNVTDFAPYMQRIKDGKPSMVFMFINSRIAALKAYQAAGLKEAGIQLMGPGDLLNDDDVSAMGDAANGVVTGGIYTSNQVDPIPQNAAFMKAWQDEYGSDKPSYLGVTGWDTMDMIYGSIKTLGPKATPEAILSYLSNWKTDKSPRGDISIDPKTRDIVQNVVVNKMEMIDGKMVNRRIDTIKDVCDPWKIVNPE
ncbi:ABC transporter substrate-binding protein [Bradyrhizobium sp. Arg237L]|uniref:ABC transporter substrate-binding protein n=1 Tax=Bradyrhizobium sp. Arg237L TaxID=3003352 RepID=UPI00249F5A5F|nr:ABC transporter substrate-binding protein [Bradyrhizobium sp. Arg237L]MDI4237104.1 ABC transporter substrate-binding protein [Bradyrhizobium sp. Arg237L]